MSLDTIPQIKGAMEAVLFASGQPVAVKKLAQGLELDLPTTQKIIEMLQKEYSEQQDKGIEIIKLGESYQMCAKKEYIGPIRTFLQLKKTSNLSQAAMETVALIAYNQPVSRSFIEEVRGVDCSGTLNSLLEKELIMEAGRFDLPGRPIAYKTTENFLRCFELGSLDDLPPIHQEETELEEEEKPTATIKAGE